MKSLLPEEEFRLYAVCSRYPHNLAGAADLKSVQAGVYDCGRGSDVIRIIVAHELARTDNNAILHLLSASPEQVRYGVEHYEQRSADTSSLLYQVFQGHNREGITMPYTMEDFRRDFTKEHLKDLTLEERLQGVPLEELLRFVPPKEIEKYLQRLKKPSSPKRKNQKK